MVTINSSNVSTSSLNRSADAIQEKLERLSSAQKLNSASDDAAGVAISEAFSSQINAQSQAIQNIGDATSLTQTASGYLDSLAAGVQRINELAVQSANGIYTDEDRAALQTEIDQITEEISSTLEDASFNDVSLFSGEEESLTFQIGDEAGDTLTVTTNDLAAQFDELGFAELSIATAEGANAAIDVTQQLSSAISAVAAEYGAVENTLASRADQLAESNINAAAAQSRIRDADIAKEVSELSAAEVLQQAGIAVQAQANKNAEGVLQLLNQV